MPFEKLLKELSPSLQRLAKKLGPCPPYLSTDDLYQEGLLHLWKQWKQGKTEGKNQSYLLKGCYFHLKNFLRCQNSKIELTTFTPTINLTEILANQPDTSLYSDEEVEYKLLTEAILENGLTKREKEVFSLLLEDLTVREIGEKLGISHVRVIKVRESIRQKVAKEIVA